MRRSWPVGVVLLMPLAVAVSACSSHDESSGPAADVVCDTNHYTDGATHVPDGKSLSVGGTNGVFPSKCISDHQVAVFTCETNFCGGEASHGSGGFTPMCNTGVVVPARSIECLDNPVKTVCRDGACVAP